MDFRIKFELAATGIRSQKNLSLRLVLGMFFVMLSAFLIVYGFTLNRQIEKNFNSSHIKDCFVVVSDEALCNKLGLSEQSLSYLTDISFGDENKLTAAKASFLIDDNEYKFINYSWGNEEGYENIFYPAAEISLGLGRDINDWLPKNLFGDDQNSYIIGSFPNNEGEILLDEYILNVLNLRYDKEQLVGKKISIFSDEKELLSNYVISGILKTSAYDIRENSEAFYYKHYEHIIIYPRAQDTYDVNSQMIKYYFKNLNEACDFADDNSTYFDLRALRKSEYLDYCYKGARYLMIIRYIVLFLCAAVMISVINITYYNIRHFADKSKKQGRLFKALGLTDKEFKDVLITEAFYIIVLAAFFSIGFFALFRFVINRILIAV